MNANCISQILPPDDDYHSGAKWTNCICPRCGKLHRKDLFWIGNLPARKFCDACQGIAERLGNIEEYQIHPQKDYSRD